MTKPFTPSQNDLTAMVGNAMSKFDEARAKALDLPEGVLRSCPLPLDVKSGTRLFLSYENGWYVVHTRFENFKKRRVLADAIPLYEGILDGSIKI